ncbi:structural protein MipA [Telmatospirillum siberiense]|uniref:Structural protein MipA n=2 Tax=Telmatospirillum siberiense TaxID=382514 RepID=A0A2N3PT74_9PROT|nr:structural protein MipA [Telmatospirillum siberiense]
MPSLDFSIGRRIHLWSPRNLRLLWASLVAGLCLIGSGAAMAQTPAPLGEWQYSAGIALRSMFQDPLPTWDGNVGIAVSGQPRYPGSSQYHIEPGPTFDLRYKDIAFLSAGEGLGVNILHDKAYRVGIALGYDVGRDQDSGRHLHGMGDISPAAEPKLFAEYVLFPVVLRGNIRRGIGGNDGWIGDLSAYMPVYGSEKFFIFAGLTTTYTDSTYQRAYYGVTPLQSRRSGYRIFTPGSGFERAGFGTNLVWYWNDHWFCTAEGAVQRLVGDAESSPLTASKVQLGLSGSIGYQF